MVSKLDENNENNNMSAGKQARLSNSTIQGGTPFTAIEEKGISTEQEYSSKPAQVRLQSKTNWYVCRVKLIGTVTDESGNSPRTNPQKKRPGLMGNSGFRPGTPPRG